MICGLSDYRLVTDLLLKVNMSNLDLHCSSLLVHTVMLFKNVSQQSNIYDENNKVRDRTLLKLIKDTIIINPSITHNLCMQFM